MLASMSIGERVREAREAANLSKAELARLCGISKQAIGQIESGVTKSPIPENLFAIARATNTNPEWLVCGSGKTMTALNAIKELHNKLSDAASPPYAGSNVAALSEGNEPAVNQIRRVPVFSTKEVLEGKQSNNNKDRVFAPAQHVSENAFAYAVNEIPNPNDRFGIDTAMLVIIDPEAEWVNGKLLLIKDSNDNLIIRRYEIVGSKRYLAPHNERYDPIELDDQFTVIGRIVGRYAHD